MPVCIIEKIEMQLMQGGLIVEKKWDAIDTRWSKEIMNVKLISPMHGIEKKK